MKLWKLGLSMFGTLALIIGISTLFFAGILSLIGSLGVVPLLALVILFNLAQWLIAPYLINGLYGVRELAPSEHANLHGIVQNLSQRMNIKAPRIGVANIPIPNAFAYGSPIAGTRIAVTSALLRDLQEEEVEAVIGHELAHLKHRDVQVMMLASVLPALFYYLGYSFLLSGSYRGRGREGGSSALIGIGSLAIYWILSLFVLHLSRLREYYADRLSATTVVDGARKLSEGLAKIVLSTHNSRRSHGHTGGLNSFKALFIADPDIAEQDRARLIRIGPPSADRELVEQILSRKVSTVDRLVEIFSTHPNIVKRIRALHEPA